MQSFRCHLHKSASVVAARLLQVSQVLPLPVIVDSQSSYLSFLCLHFSRLLLLLLLPAPPEGQRTQWTGIPCYDASTITYYLKCFFIGLSSRALEISKASLYLEGRRRHTGGVEVRRDEYLGPHFS